jgi:hypothetical protein
VTATDRKSLPPGLESLREVAKKHREHNDKVEKSVGHIPLPLAVRVATVPLDDEQRLAVLHEIHAECRSSGGSTVIALERYEDKVRTRLAGGKAAAE